MKRVFKPLLMSLPLACSLAACGGGNRDVVESGNPPTTKPITTDTSTTKTDAVATDYSKLAVSQLEPGSLRQASTSELTNLIKNGLRVTLREYPQALILEAASAPPKSSGDVAAKPVGEAAAGTKSGGFSGTNVQVAGVDEGDHTKYDGKYIYLTSIAASADGGVQSHLKIFATDTNNPKKIGEMSSTLLIENKGIGSDDIYLVSGANGTEAVASVHSEPLVYALGKPIAVPLPTPDPADLIPGAVPAVMPKSATDPVPATNTVEIPAPRPGPWPVTGPLPEKDPAPVAGVDGGTVAVGGTGPEPATDTVEIPAPRPGPWPVTGPLPEKDPAPAAGTDGTTVFVAGTGPEPETNVLIIPAPKPGPGPVTDTTPLTDPAPVTADVMPAVEPAPLFPIEDPAFGFAYWAYPQNSSLKITLYDVNNPAAVEKAWSIAIDGQLRGTRKIGNTLYVISSYVPTIATLDFAGVKLGAPVSNETMIANTPLEKLLPEYTLDDGKPQPLIGADGCLVPANTTQTTGNLNLISVTAIDLAKHQLIKSVCVNSPVENIYTSNNNIYLVGSEYRNWESWKNFSVVHQLALSETGIHYAASGEVEGDLGWSAPAFRMDEHDGFLRMLTSTVDATGQRSHRLNILKKVEGRSELALVAQLPNKVSPEPIGKPNEDVYGVRYDGDKAYVVTFERKDPLYVLDLTDPLAPKQAGHLEIPGFSTYLHPVGKNYLFSFGNNTDDAGFISGLKASLYDVRNPSNPVEVGNYIVEGNSSFSPAVHDSRAFSFLQASDDQLRVAIPMTINDPKLNGIAPYGGITPSLYEFEINGLAQSNATLTLAARLAADSASSQGSGWNSTEFNRGILHDDAVFFVQGDSVVGSKWGVDSVNDVSVIDVSEKQNGSTLHVTPGQYVRITLPESASTGYQWQIDYYNPKFMTSLNFQYSLSSRAASFWACSASSRV